MAQPVAAGVLRGAGMKLVFSEGHPDYSRYAFPYVVWGFPESGETPADFFDAGFLPSGPQLDRFYLCRQLRVRLRGWEPTSENRRVLRKGSGIRCDLVPRAGYDYRPDRRAAWLAYAHERFGPGVMPESRLDRLMASPVITHVLTFTDNATGVELGNVLMYVEARRVAYYYFAFYDTSQPSLNLGMLMMTRAVDHFFEDGFKHLHLGTCYEPRALYKAQFIGTEYFTGWRWSDDLEALKALVRQAPATGHLLEDADHPAACAGKTVELPGQSGFRVTLR